MTYLELAAGLALLLGGAELLVRGSVSVARHLGVSPLVVGLVLVGFGTSTPELAASVEAALFGAPGIAVGNVVGSNIANILLILGLTAVLSPIASRPEAFRRDGAVLMASTILLLVLCVWMGEIARPVAALLVVMLVAYSVWAYHDDRRHAPPAAIHMAEAESVPTLTPRLAPALAAAVAGLVAVVGGSGLLVDAAVALATGLGVSEAVIGLTIVAVGTSLPELVASVTAALRRHTEVALGNIIGSNIFNALGILGVTALVEPLAVPSEIARFDVWALMATTILFIVAAVTGWRISRREGLALLAGYGAYLVAILAPGVRAALALPVS